MNTNQNFDCEHCDSKWKKNKAIMKKHNNINHVGQKANCKQCGEKTQQSYWTKHPHYQWAYSCQYKDAKKSIIFLSWKWYKFSESMLDEFDY